MQVTETLAEGLKREFTVVIPAKDFDEKMQGRLDELGKTVKLPGFRPGKVPAHLLKQKYGPSLKGEILEQTISDSWQSTIQEKGLRPALEPKIEIVSFEEGQDLEYKLAVELLPEIVAPDFSKLKLERFVAELDDEAVDRALERIAEEHKTYDPVDRPARQGDQVRIDFVGRLDGEEFEGGNGTDVALDLGSNSFIPGFEDQLAGAETESKNEVKVTIPEDYPAENLRGKEAVFEVDVKEILEPKVPAIDDTLAQAMGMADVAALRDAVKEQIDRDYKGLSRARLKRGLLDTLSDTQEFEVPPGMVDREFDAIWQRVSAGRDQGELDPEDAEKGEDELKDQYKPIAERRVRLGLLLSEVGRANNISVAQEDLNRAMSEEARRYPGQERQVLEFFQKNPSALHELEAPIFEDKVVDFILEMADVSERTVSQDELVKEPDASAVAESEEKGETP